MMLHGLESRDGAAELLAHLGVVDCGLDAVGRPAHRLSSKQRPRPGQRRFPRPHHDVLGPDAHVVQPDTSGTPSGIEVAWHLDRDTGPAALQQQHVVARGDQQQLGKSGAEHDSGVAVGDTVGDLDPAVQPDARGDGPVDQAGQQPRLLFAGAIFGDHRRRDHSGDERSGRHRATEFFNHHDEFGQSEAGATVFLVDVQAKPVEFDDALPECGPALVRCVQQRSRRPTRLLGGQEAAGYSGELAVIVGQCDTHDGLLAALPTPRGRKGG